MQVFFLVADITVAVLLAFLGSIVLLKNSYKQLNRIFFVFTLLIGAWIISNYYSNDQSLSNETSQVANAALFFFCYYSALFLLKFILVLTEDKQSIARYKSFAPLIYFVGLVSLTPLMITGVEEQGTVTAVHFGLGAIPYFTGVVGMIMVGLHILKKKAESSLLTGNKQFSVIYIYMSVGLTGLLITNFLLPTATGFFGLTNIGIFFTLLPVGALLYSISRHRLFDLKPVLARSAGYLLTVFVLAVTNGLIIFGLANYLFDINLSLTVQIALSIASAISGLFFSKAQEQFNKLTNQIFYRDSYDPQDFYDHFNKALASTLHLEKLLTIATKIVADKLKAQYVVVGLREDASHQIRIIGTRKIPIDSSDIALARHLTPKIHQSVIYRDYLEDADYELKGLMDKNDIAVIVRMTPNVHRTEEGLGYICLGPKKSGNAYTSLDLRVLDTAGKELIIAVQNALRFEEIESFSATLQAQVEAQTRKLRMANEKLKALDETKDDFISMASHQLRTPLTSVKGYISMVLEEDAGKITPMQREMLGQAFFSSQRMVYLIADLLNVSRLKTGKFIIERAPIHLDQIVEQELRQLQETAAARSLTLEFNKPEDFPTMMLDETKTRQIIMNFIDNAIYYTPAGGHIIVRLVNNQQSIELRVEDNGIGVPKLEQAHLFTKFYRAGNARQARPDGTGLGLFMAKKVIVAQGGSLLFDSVEGKGSTFGFVFSKSWAAETPKAKTPSVKELKVALEPVLKK